MTDRAGAMVTFRRWSVGWVLEVAISPVETDILHKQGTNARIYAQSLQDRV